MSVRNVIASLAPRGLPAASANCSSLEVCATMSGAGPAPALRAQVIRHAAVWDFQGLPFAIDIGAARALVLDGPCASSALVERWSDVRSADTANHMYDRQDLL